MLFYIDYLRLASAWVKAGEGFVNESTNGVKVNSTLPQKQGTCS